MNDNVMYKGKRNHTMYDAWDDNEYLYAFLRSQVSIGCGQEACQLAQWSESYWDI